MKQTKVLWAVQFKGSGRKPVLLEDAWRDHWRREELGHWVLFQSRRAAREWCLELRRKYDYNVRALRWRFTPVRITVTVRRTG